MKFAHYSDASGEILGFYETEIHAEIPVPSIELSATEWQDCVDNQGMLYVDVGNMTIKNIVLSSDRLLTIAKDDKIREIRAAFSIAENLPIVVNGIEYHGGYESCTRLDVARRLALESGALVVQFFDIYNVTHDLTLEEAKAVVLTISTGFQSKFRNKQNKMVAIAQAESISELGNISY